MKFFRLALLLAIVFTFSSCVSIGNGANWFYADFSTYDKNFKDFDVSNIRIGMSEKELTDALPQYSPKIVAESKTTKTFQYEKWRAVPGPDYLEQKLFIKFENGEVVEYQIVNDVAITNPW